MHTILITETDPKTQKQLKAGLKQHLSAVKIISSKDTQGTIATLNRTPVSMLIVDLQNPKIDSLALLASMIDRFPETPCFILGDHELIQSKKYPPRDIYHYVHKPFDLKTLTQDIVDVSKKEAFGGALNGISIPNFLQMIEAEAKTCFLQIYPTGSDNGFLYFDKGILYDAVCGELRGVDAALKLVAIEHAEIRLKDNYRETVKRTINMSLIGLIVEATHRKDQDEIASVTDTEAVDDGKYDILLEEIDKAMETTIAPSEAATKPTEAIPDKKLQKSLEKQIQKLKKILGYKAAAIMRFTGEILAFDSNDSQIDLSVVGATFNEILEASHEASRKAGLGESRELIIRTPKGLIVMTCSGTAAKAHVHLIGILSAKGNYALMRLEFGGMITKIVDEIASSAG